MKHTSIPNICKNADFCMEPVLRTSSKGTKEMPQGVGSVKIWIGMPYNAVTKDFEKSHFIAIEFLIWLIIFFYKGIRKGSPIEIIKELETKFAGI